MILNANEMRAKALRIKWQNDVMNDPETSAELSKIEELLIHSINTGKFDVEWTSRTLSKKQINNLIDFLYDKGYEMKLLKSTSPEPKRGMWSRLSTKPYLLENTPATLKEIFENEHSYLIKW